MRTTFRTEGPAPARPGRFRAAWQAAHRPVDGVSRCTRLIAYAVPLTVLPSSVWRLPAVFSHGVSPGERVYIVFLSVVSEVLAFTAVGLVARWGEVFPRWVPFLRGRRVPVGAAVVPAAAGAVVLTLLWTVAVPVTEVMDVTIRGDEVPSDYPGKAGGWEAAWFYLCYAPLVLWGPLLGVLAVAYAKRRRAVPRG
ncbi:hypothetical protein M4914_16205 [Streptomyces somaliensis DSM 40738]|uniref:Uncharacterized protein n=1 Tax=Streptomyces somaliensis (strain ATCC 33201 / DSM 40738 / JCM 12659 / KCTC 9044 / NCTC 11332 / NRRL B-12077 / IP 733) TaxID=1134445 RepID=A0AA44DA23_STRE0|nr:hypothetical protein [Streptomyces somaliensis]MCQ0024350.1 hypothetical protein [Streptomyces somaliensis DSM 40738]NKY12663.1 hypothetical protein [Streptomyces somaliensis DSM 40738]